MPPIAYAVVGIISAVARKISGPRPGPSLPEPATTTSPVVAAPRPAIAVSITGKVLPAHSSSSPARRVGFAPIENEQPARARQSRARTKRKPPTGGESHRKGLDAADLKGIEAYDLEVTLKSGDTEHHFLDVELPARQEDLELEGQGPMTVAFGDYKKVQGRMVKTWTGDEDSKSAVSAVVFDKAIDAKLFALPKN